MDWSSFDENGICYTSIFVDDAMFSHNGPYGMQHCQYLFECHVGPSSQLSSIFPGWLSTVFDCRRIQRQQIAHCHRMCWQWQHGRHYHWLMACSMQYSETRGQSLLSTIASVFSLSALHCLFIYRCVCVCSVVGWISSVTVLVIGSEDCLRSEVCLCHETLIHSVITSTEEDT